MRDKLEAVMKNSTIYQLTLYGLLVLAAYSFILAFVGALDFNPLTMLITLIILVVVGYIVNHLLARLLRIQPNFESTFITSLLLFFMFSPPGEGQSYLLTVTLAAFASASKYMLVWRRRHIFNPAVVAAVFVAFAGLGQASWWIGSWLLLPAVLVIGSAIVCKLGQLRMAMLYVASSWLLMATYFLTGQSTSWAMVLSVLFFALFLLTDPLTQPPRRHERYIYAVGVAVIGAVGLQVGQTAISPEIALLCGNIFAFLCGQRRAISLELLSRVPLPDHHVEYIFKSRSKLRFAAGWCIEIQLGGRRQRFVIAPSSNSTKIKITVRYHQSPNDFLKLLARLPIDATVPATGPYDSASGSSDIALRKRRNEQ